MSRLMALAKECDPYANEDELAQKVDWAKNNPGWMKSLLEFKRNNTFFDLLVEYRLKAEGYPRDDYALALVANNAFVIDDVYFSEDITENDITFFREAVVACS